MFPGRIYKSSVLHIKRTIKVITLNSELSSAKIDVSEIATPKRVRTMHVGKTITYFLCQHLTVQHFISLQNRAFQNKVSQKGGKLFVLDSVAF
jgi:hypothetical protein